MPGICVVGAQWGDEAKARVVDVEAERAEVVVRSQGGANAGHTVVVGEEKFILHLLPCGVLHPGKMNVMGNGMVIDPAYLMEEMAGLVKRGVKLEGNLLISDRAHVVMPYHKVMDQLAEKRASGAKIGTTGRGIGPCYADKMARVGFRVADLYDEEVFRARLRRVLVEKNLLLTQLYGAEPMREETIWEEYRGYAEKMKPLVAETQTYLVRALKQGKRVLFEGAQGALLDIDHGTYPFVTSSNASVFGVAAGSGVPPRYINEVIGVTKAYTTRVGEGPFPTELEGELGEHLRERGAEFGATTGRPRRCGWLDAVACRYVSELNGFDSLAITKLDVLSGQKVVKVCVGYEHKGKRIERFPSELGILEQCKPVYEDHRGWTEDVTGARRFEELPKAARDYVSEMERLLGAPARMVSVGPEREQVIIR